MTGGLGCVRSLRRLGKDLVHQPEQSSRFLSVFVLHEWYSDVEGLLL